MGFKRNEQMGCSKAFRGNANCVKHPRVTSHVGTPTNVSGEKMNRPKEVKKMSRKQAKLKVIIHVFRLSRCPSSERHEMTPRDLGGQLKEVMWLGTNMWMHLRSFRGSFRFHEK